MFLRIPALLPAVLAAGVLLQPAAAMARDDHRGGYQSYQGGGYGGERYREHRGHDRTGLIIGGVAAGVLGCALFCGSVPSYTYAPPPPVAYAPPPAYYSAPPGYYAPAYAPPVAYAPPPVYYAPQGYYRRW